MFNGKKIKISLFGESHGSCVGASIEGIPCGIKIDMDYINDFMLRRKSVNKLSTARREEDVVNILSGVFNGYTTGLPLTIVIDNKDIRSSDYKLPRPSHSDYTQYNKYHGFCDLRGGGGFSGRLTAPLCFIGGLCSYILEQRGILVGSHISSVLDIEDAKFDKCNIKKELVFSLRKKQLPVIDDKMVDIMGNAILEAKKRGDSCGGCVEICVIGIREFIGGNYFSRLQSKLSSLIFSIPAVVALEFGSGFNMTKTFGSIINDELCYNEDKEFFTKTNNSGGINGGITNTMPIILKVGFRPTPSISIDQCTIDIESKKNVVNKIHGRHDPCIVIRGAVVVEAMVAIGIFDEIGE